jgi:hypothetical protein
MRRPSGLLLACAMTILPLCSPAFAQGPAATTQPAAPQKMTFTGDAVLWAVTVNADKAADFEQVMSKVKEALIKTDTPETKQQVAGWKVIKNTAPQPDGSLLYVHVISPVVKEADYSLTNIYYKAFTDPAEQKAFYDMYRGALKSTLFQIQAPIVADMSK